MDNGCDLLLALTSHWQKANSVLDVGSGYGRVIRYLIENNFQGKITSVERCESLFQYLNSQFKNNLNVTRLNKDILKANFKDKFDVIFILWSGLSNFPSQDQPLLIIKLAKLLNKNGKLIIDTMPENIKPLQSNQQYGNQVFLIKVNDATVHTYEPTSNEMHSYALQAGLSNIERISCHTDI